MVNQAATSYPDDLRYTKDHEWVRIEGDRAKVGITHHAQDQLGDVVFLELPEVGRKLGAHDTFGTVESVKAVSELFSPVAGEVVAINEPLTKTPEVVNTDPYGAAWLVELKLDDASTAAADLMDAAAYRTFVETEGK